ncbi:MAG: T9SS type A sorting domain-containing protein [Chitinophagaceae bacterium]|nr:T9SS type A sorting domain-containing protein [Chitinophagaceae bacterium]
MKINLLLITLFLLQFNSQAQTFQWSKTVGTTANGFITPIANTNDNVGNYLVAGTFADAVDFDPGPAVVSYTGNQNSESVFIQQFNANGTLNWAKAIISATATLTVQEVKTDAANNVYLIGFFDATTDFDPGVGISNLTPQGVLDMYILKLDINGNFVWVKGFGGTNTYISPNSLKISSTGKIIMCGSYDGSFDTDPGPNSSIITSTNSAAFLISLDNIGNFLWSKSFSSTNNIVINRVRTDANENVISAGSFSGTCDFDPGPLTFNLTSLNAVSLANDNFVLKLDVNGNYLWANAFGGNDDEYVIDMEVDNAGDVITTGNFTGTSDFDPSANTFNLTAPNASEDIFLMKLNSNGNFAWAKQITGNTNEVVSDLAIDNQNFIYSTGYIEGQTDFDPGAATNFITPVVNTVDGFVLKLDNSGNFVRVNQINSSQSDEGGFTIQVDAQNNIYSTGLYDQTIDFDPQVTVSSMSPIGLAFDAYYFKWSQCIPTTATQNVTGCSYTFNGQTFSGNGTYTAILQNASGCDSIITINLSGSSTNTTLNPTICSGVYTLNGQTYTSTGSYIQNYLNVAGCDSNYIINLTVGAPSSNTITTSACDFYTTPQNFYSTSGTYTEIYQNASGCDSTLTLNLTINNSYQNSITTTSCGPYTFGGQLYTSTGLYTLNFQTVNGCDSIIDLNLTINPMPNNGVSQSGATLSSLAAAPTLYQWVNCPGYTLIAGANAQSYTALVSGDYAVIVSNGNCIDTSDCFNVVISGIKNENLLANQLIVSPNPFNDFISIKFLKNISELEFNITSATGQILKKDKLTKVENATIDVANFAQGVYFLNLKADGQQATIKIVKQ